MKRVKMLLALMLMTTVIVGAQEKHRRHGPKGAFHKDLSVEQLATLKTKKMTLALDLSEKQQREILEFNKANAEFRKKKMAERKAKKETGERTRPTTDEQYAMANAKLDHMIAQQQELKKILTDEQFDEWKKMQLRKHAHGKKNRQKEGRRG